MTHRHNRREAGLTLIEMLIAVALLGIVLLGIAPLFIASVKSNYSGNEYTSIHNLARDRLEQLLDLPVTNPELTEGTHAGPVGSKNGDLSPFLPDPLTGVLPSPIVNTLSRTYVVSHWRFPVVDISLPNAIANGAVFVSTQVTPPGRYDFKRIDVTVTSNTIGSGLGIGQRTARVSGFIRNPDPVNNVH